MSTRVIFTKLGKQESQEVHIQLETQYQTLLSVLKKLCIQIRMEQARLF